MTHQYSDNIVNPHKINDKIYYGYDGNVELTGDGYVQIPAGATADRPAEPEVGMVRYNTSTNEFEGYSGSGWAALASGATIEYVNYFYDGTSVPSSSISNTGRLGRNYGVMYELNTTNQPNAFYGPTVASGNPTLTYINFDPSTGTFAGFLTEATYLINTSFEVKNDGTGSGSIPVSIVHQMDAKSGSNIMNSAVGTYVKLPDSVYGGSNYTPWDQAVNMSTVATFTDPDPGNNILRIELDSNQSQYYWVIYGFVSIIRIA